MNQSLYFLQELMIISPRADTMSAMARIGDTINN